MSTTKAEYEAELAVIKARADYYERPDLISRRTFLETELNRLINGATQPGNKPPAVQPDNIRGRDDIHYLNIIVVTTVCHFLLLNEHYIPIINIKYIIMI